MAIRSIEAPASRRRQSTQFFTDKEIEQAVKVLEAGGTPGDGPFETIKGARREAARLKKELEARSELTVGTQAWEDEDGAHYVVKVREAE